MTTTPLDLQALALAPTAALETLHPPTADAAPAVLTQPGRYLLLDAGLEQQAIPLTRQITHLGRGFAATIQLEDQSVSRRHAIVTQRRGTVRILDDRSSNGTFVNGTRIAEAELHDGDVIVLGRAVLVYREV